MPSPCVVWEYFLGEVTPEMNFTEVSGAPCDGWKPF